MKIKKNSALAIIIIGLLAFGLWRYWVIAREQKIVAIKLQEAQNRLTSLESEKAVLRQELDKELKMKEDLLGEKARLETDLAAKTEEFNQQGARLAEVESALNRVEAEKEQLGGQVAVLTQEKEQLEAKLSSVEELKKVIKELKIKMRQMKSRVMKIIEPRYTYGNKGYIVQNGVSTYLLRKKIEVTPLP